MADGGRKSSTAKDAKGKRFAETAQSQVASAMNRLLVQRRLDARRKSEEGAMPGNQDAFRRDNSAISGHIQLPRVAGFGLSFARDAIKYD